MKIYVVFGSTGEYSDRTEWLIKAFSNAEKAKELVINATQEADRIRVKYKSSYFNWDSKNDPNKYDPKMLLDYTGTSYYYQSVELD